ncbi:MULTISPECIES: nitrate reductase cytochrome c-type subunit [Neobacillus]|uniref:Nitrate reductase cytochrome c-type subunit n=1 Tax=Neobacillus citreus TaxID=2833578 RepID=A0A942SUX7_9BACI|nr:nitrate reductase cytochrome c-type subunit [Neobacillus citreus]
MKEKGILYIVAFVVVLGLAIGGTKLQWSMESSAKVSTKTTNVQLVQLAEKGRPNAETMGLIGAPPLQPASHVDRWNPQAHQDSCLACHGKPDTGAPTPPDNHFYNNDTKGKIFRDNCVQCHGQQNETKTKTAFSK